MIEITLPWPLYRLASDVALVTHKHYHQIYNLNSHVRRGLVIITPWRQFR